MLSKELEKKLEEKRIQWATKSADTCLKKDDPRRVNIEVLGILPWDEGARALAEILVEELDKEIKFYSAPTNFTEEFRKGNLNQLNTIKTLLTGGK